MSSIKAMWKSSGIGGRMTLLILSLFLITILTTTGIVYNVFSNTYEDGVQDRLNATASMNTESFMDWLLASHTGLNSRKRTGRVCIRSGFLLEPVDGRGFQ